MAATISVNVDLIELESRITLDKGLVSGGHITLIGMGRVILTAGKTTSSADKHRLHKVERVS